MTTRERTADIKNNLDTIAATVNTKWVSQAEGFHTIVRLKNADDIYQARTRLTAAGYWVAEIDEDTLTV